MKTEEVYVAASRLGLAKKVVEIPFVVYITDDVKGNVENPLMSTWSWVFFIAIMAVMWEKLEPNRFF